MSALKVAFTAHESPLDAAPPRIGKAGGVSMNGRPLSPTKGRKGRPFFTDTVLGQMISDRGLKVVEVSVGAGVNPRSLSYYMSRKKKISPANVARLAAFFDVDPAVFLAMNAELDAV